MILLDDFINKMLHFKQVLLNFSIRVDIAALATTKIGISFQKFSPNWKFFFRTHEYGPTGSERVNVFLGGFCCPLPMT